MTVFHRWALLLLVLLLAACNLASTAPQDIPQQQNDVPANEWTAYLQNPQRKELLRVTADGSASIYPLGIGDEHYLSSFDMSFNADGSRVAFCLITFQPDSPISRVTLYVRDVITQTNVLKLDLASGEGVTCSIGRHAYHDNQVAVGVMNYAPFAQNPDTSQPQWQVNIVDVTTGTRVNEVNAEVNPLDVSNEFGGMLTLPIIQRFDGAEVIFAFTTYGSEGPLDAPAFAWDIASGRVQRVEYWGKSGLDALSTGELAYPDNDPNLPAGMPMGPMGTFNVLRVVDGVEPRTVFHTPDWLIGSARFINHGQQVAILLLPSFNPDMPESNAITTRWMAVDRTGRISELLASPYYAEVMSAPNGYVVLSQDYVDGDFQQGTFTLTLNANRVETPLWQSGIMGGEVWELVWVTPTTTAADLAVFPTFAQ